MDQFRKEMKRRMVLLSICFVLLGSIAGILSMNQGMMQESIYGFQLGIVFGLLALAAVYVVRLRIAMRNETKLRMLYNEEHDERMKLIRSKAGMPMLLMTSSLLLIAAVVFGYFNSTIFYTLVLAAMFQLTLGAVIKLYYMKTI